MFKGFFLRININSPTWYITTYINLYRRQFVLSRIQLRPTVLYYIHNWCQTDATTGLRGYRHALGRLLPESPNYSSWRGNPIWPRMGVATAESKSGIKCEGMQIIWNGCLKSNCFLKCCSWSEITPKFRRARRAVCASVHTKLTFCKTITALKLLGKKSMCYYANQKKSRTFKWQFIILNFKIIKQNLRPF